MSRKTVWKRYVSVLIAFALVLGSILGAGNQKVEAAAGKTIRSVGIMQGGKNVTKKTLSMKKGSSKKLTVKAKTTLTKKEIKYKSSNKKVVSVNKNGKLQAKQYGSARITVTVSKKDYKTKKTWVKVSVMKDTAQAPTGAPGTTEVPTAAPTEAPDSTVAPTTMPDVTPVPTPDVPKDPGSSTEEGKILVAYFSWSGTSERIAQNIISQTGADSFRIERETPYSDDYTIVAYGEAKEEADNNARPPLKDPLDSVAAYDKIILCYPIWWFTMPQAMFTFLEEYDFSGKTIIPFATHGGYGVGSSVEDIQKLCPDANVVEDIFEAERDDISKQIKEIGNWIGKGKGA